MMTFPGAIKGLMKPTAFSTVAIVGVLLGLYLLTIPSAQAEKVMEVRHSIEFSQSDITFDHLQGYDVVRTGGGDYLVQQGRPMLPAQEIRIALPSGMAARTVRIVASTLVEIDGEFDILPAQPPQRVGQKLDDIVFVPPDAETYASSLPYPSTPVELIAQMDLAGQAMAAVKICPFEYVPAEKKLRHYSSITLEVSGVDGYICGDYLPADVSEKDRRTYEATVKNMVVNADAVALTGSPHGALKIALPSPGPFAHVIITSDGNQSYWAPLVEWHIKKGVRDTVITTSYIYANYSGSDNQDKLRNFVIDAHDNWGTLYFLIGGEGGTVPFEYRVYDSENIPSDQYYGDYDNDWIYEVYVGRVTAEGSTQINCFIDKVLKYETDPPLDDYALNACLLGMDLTLASQAPYYTLTASEDMKEAIDNYYIPARFNVTEVYDSDATDHRTKFINAFNAGQNLVNHSDHSNSTIMGTGDLNHNSYLSSSHVNSLNNDGRLCNVFSLGCHPNHMDYSDCIAEYFVIYNNLQAGVSFTGNTRSGWFYVGDAASLSGLLDMYWWRGMLVYNQYRLGEALAWTKNNCPHNSSWYYVQWTLNLLGEPEMPIWTDTIKTLVVTHAPSFPTSGTSFDVHVENTGGDPVNFAYVCLWKGDEVYETGWTDLSGDLSLPIGPASHGDMFVTVTAQNCVPYQGMSVCSGNLPPVASFTCNPATPTRHDTTQFSSTSYDSDGSIISWDWDFGDGDTASGENVGHQYNSYGEFTATLVVTDDFSAGDTVQVMVAVVAICGDIDDSGSGPDIADLIYLVDYMFNGGPEPLVLATADVDGTPGIEIGDLVYLVDYMFNGGPAPCP